MSLGLVPQPRGLIPFLARPQYNFIACLIISRFIGQHIVFPWVGIAFKWYGAARGLGVVCPCTAPLRVWGWCAPVWRIASHSFVASFIFRRLALTRGCAPQGRDWTLPRRTTSTLGQLLSSLVAGAPSAHVLWQGHDLRSERCVAVQVGHQFASYQPQQMQATPTPIRTPTPAPIPKPHTYTPTYPYTSPQSPKQI